MKDKAHGSANNGAYFVCVTAVCGFTQRSKQNHSVILRLCDFFDSLMRILFNRGRIYMKIEAPAENRIIIELSAEDMSALNIPYEEMDYSNIETRRVVWTLLDKAGHVLNRDIDPSGRMVIEAVPASCGGCVLKFTLYHSDTEYAHCTRATVHRDNSLFVCEFSSLDDIMDAAVSLPGELTFGSSEIYELDGKYRLLFRPLCNGARCRLLLSEFGHELPNASLSAADTREHWRCVIKSDALAKLGGKYFC